MSASGAERVLGGSSLAVVPRHAARRALRAAGGQPSGKRPVPYGAPGTQLNVHDPL
ncbi:hypothetical protein XAP6984_1130020 [Xanthomonas phaseoli pv. phaseoli]|uniref:Secreted protein n=1 Tax=Xanthomonas campestris pv. phaseoli TaxID=317013 RepID=A0ABY1TPU2_XANCH|nr:hypothetical protein XAP6984_1130020 [Xanthomonas phaseoli pv. phaseoli]